MFPRRSPRRHAAPCPSAAPIPPGLAATIFRGLYPDLDLLAAEGAWIAVPKGTPVFASATLTGVAAQISVAAGESR